MKKIPFLLLVFISIIGCKNELTPTKEISDTDLAENLTTAEKIANRNGYQYWDKITELKFTFNVDRGERHFERSWVWKPKLKDVIYISDKDSIRYNQDALDSISQKTDASFINDKYWLLAPFNLAWDKGTSFSEEKNRIAPISKDTLNKLTIVYGNEGGYTPGDAYDFFYSNDYEIKEWVFRKGNDSLPSMITTWEDYKDFGEIKIATTHKDSLGKFKISFTNISVK